LKISGKTDHVFDLQERLGELPANDQHVGNEAQQNGQTEGVQGGH